jgi:hypothetical protein
MVNRADQHWPTEAVAGSDLGVGRDSSGKLVQTD